MANVVITGGAGFIGSHLSARLLGEGHTIFCIDNLVTGDKANIVKLLDNPKFSFFQHDVIQPLTELEERISEVHYVFHLASPASPNAQSPRSYINHPIETLLVNVQGTHNMLQFAKEHSAKFLFASTSEVYGDPSVSPQPETYFGNVNSYGVRAIYDEGKRAGEALIYSFRKKFQLDARIVRIFNTYGPNMQRDDGRVVSNFITQALTNTPLTIYGDGSQTRSFCYIDDMVEGLTRLMFTEGTDGEVVNIGNPDERKISEIATLIKEMLGNQSEVVHAPLPQDDPMKRKPDITKAKKLLQWEPKVTLEEGLKKTIEYFRNI